MDENKTQFEQFEQIISILMRIEKTLEGIEKKLEKSEIVETRRIEFAETERVDFDPFVLLELPDNLRSTLLALIKLKEGTATDVSSITGRGRAIESHYLNTLVRMGYVSKRRNGRVVYYKVKEA